MLRYRRSQEMDERAITAHLIRRMRQFQEREAAQLGVVLNYDARLAESEQGPESFHGADFAVWLRGGGLSLALRLQAKRLKPLVRSPGTYSSLDHTVRSTGDRQVDLLIGNTPSYMNPGYLFYNALETPPGVRTGCCRGKTFGLDVLGMTVASAHAIRGVLPEKTAADVLPVSVPAHCVVACSRTMPFWQHWGIPIFSDDVPLPLRAAFAFLHSSPRGPEPVRLLADPAAELSPQVQEILSGFPDGTLEVMEDSVPEYVDTVESEGSLGISDDDDDRPARVVAVLRSGDGA